MDGGRVFAAAFAWLLAVIYLASAPLRGSRLQAGIIRLERNDRPQALGPTLRAFLSGHGGGGGDPVSVRGFGLSLAQLQRLRRHHRRASDRAGALMLAYLIVAALASLLASSPEKI